MMNRVIVAAASLLSAMTWLWPRELRNSTVAEYQHLLTAILFDTWQQGGWSAFLLRSLYEASDLLVVAVRGRPVRARAAVSMFAVAALVLALVLPLLRTPLHAELLVVDARDPAGEFTLTFQRGGIVAATVDGVPYVGRHLVQTSDSVRIVDARGRTLVAVAFEAPGTIRWAARTEVRP